ncbi:MAG: hypothetical protein HY903_19910 [Deltaproteobacteria bacterium]|nr:hypothetical protein [Deltaproteobacteria bacterium]
MTAFRRLLAVTGPAVVAVALVLHLADLRILIGRGHFSETLAYAVWPFSTLIRLVLFGGLADLIVRSPRDPQPAAPMPEGHRDQLGRLWTVSLLAVFEIVVLALASQ